MQRHFRLIRDDPTLRLLTLCALLHGVFASAVSIYQSLVAVTVFGISDQTYAAILLIAMAVAVGASIGVGIVTDQRPSRRLMALTACTMVTIGTASVWLIHSKAAFMVAHMFLIPLSGSFFGQLFAVARLATAHLPRIDRDSLLAILRAMFAVPFMVALPIWGWAFGKGLPLTAIYPVVTLTGVVLVALIWQRWPRDRAAPWTEVKSGLSFRASLGEITTPPILIRVALIGVMLSGGAICGTVLGLLFAVTPGRGPADVGIFFGVFVAIEVIVTLCIGQFLRVMKRSTCIALGCLQYALFLALLPVLAATPMVWLLIVPAGAGGAMMYALVIGYLQDLLGSRAGAGASLIALQQLASQTLAAAVFAIGTWLYGYALVSVLGAAAIIAATLTLHWLDRGRPD